jgi:hypothetical protein
VGVGDAVVEGDEDATFAWISNCKANFFRFSTIDVSSVAGANDLICAAIEFRTALSLLLKLDKLVISRDQYSARGMQALSRFFPVLTFSSLLS